MSTCNRSDLQTIGSRPVMPKNLPDHCSSLQNEGLVSTHECYISLIHSNIKALDYDAIHMYFLN